MKEKKNYIIDFNTIIISRYYSQYHNNESLLDYTKNKINIWNRQQSTLIGDTHTLTPYLQYTVLTNNNTLTDNKPLQDKIQLSCNKTVLCSNKEWCISLIQDFMQYITINGFDVCDIHFDIKENDIIIYSSDYADIDTCIYCNMIAYPSGRYGIERYSECPHCSQRSDYLSMNDTYYQNDDMDAVLNDEIIDYILQKKLINSIQHMRYKNKTDNEDYMYSISLQLGVLRYYDQQYGITEIINGVKDKIDKWNTIFDKKVELSLNNVFQHDKEIILILDIFIDSKYYDTTLYDKYNQHKYIENLLMSKYKLSFIS